MTIPLKYEDVVAQLEDSNKLCDSLERSMKNHRHELGLSNSREAALREELALIIASFDELAACVDFSEARLDQTGDSPIDCANQLQQRLTVAERDARRYRYLREGAVMHYMSAEGSESKDAYLTITGYGHDDSAESIDNAIDAQILAALKPAAEGEGS